MKGSDKLESFLTQVKIELLSIGWDTEIPENKDKYQEISRLLQSLGESDIFIVPNDKTKRFRSMKKQEVKTMVKEHLKQSSREIERGRVTEIFQGAKVILYEIGFRMSKNKVGHINESLKTNLFQHPNY